MVMLVFSIQVEMMMKKMMLRTVTYLIKNKICI